MLKSPEKQKKQNCTNSKHQTTKLYSKNIEVYLTNYTRAYLTELNTAKWCQNLNTPEPKRFISAPRGCLMRITIQSCSVWNLWLGDRIR